MIYSDQSIELGSSAQPNDVLPESALFGSLHSGVPGLWEKGGFPFLEHPLVDVFVFGTNGTRHETGQ